MYNKAQIAEKIKITQCKICYYRYMSEFNPCYYSKNYFINLANNEEKKLEELLDKDYRTKYRKANFNRQQEFTLEELSKYNGSGGKPAYVAINGVVYDVSMNPPWGGGTHFGLYAGKDLTSEFAECHKGNIGIINNLPKVGKLKV